MTTLITQLIDKLNKKVVVAVLLVIMIVTFIVWLIDAAVTHNPNFESLASFLKVFNTILPALLEGM